MSLPLILLGKEFLANTQPVMFFGKGGREREEEGEEKNK
jgi:hypothetical protein